MNINNNHNNNNSISFSNNRTVKSSSPKILVVEDELHIAQGISFNLEQEGMQVKIATDGQMALDFWKLFDPDLIVLDLMLPTIPGTTVLEKIRAEDENIPILILSAKDQLSDKLQGFTLGADDYLTKPFHLEEFLCRVKRQLRHRQCHTYQFGNNQIDFDTNWARTTEGEFRLTEQEVKLLKIFINSPNKIISKPQLLQEGWGYQQVVETRTLDIFIARLRKYFESDPKNPKHFIGVRNQGIIFSPNG